MNHISKSLAIATALSLLSIPAYASHGVDALGAAMMFIFGLDSLTLVSTVTCLFVAMGNISRKSKKRRIISGILTLPLLGLSFLFLKLNPMIGFVGLCIFLLLCWLIYKSMNAPDAENI